MKINRIQIKRFRGIKELTLELNYENAVIWGPNGSGKSAVVDAIDFVLTGKIPRLLGHGTQGVTLAKHGPHIDHVDQSTTSEVKAVIQIPGVFGEVCLSRCVANPESLEITGAELQQIDSLLGLARRRQHSLSRREILKYIAEQSGNRSEAVQAVLDLSDLESTRKALVKVRNLSREQAAGTSSRLLPYKNSLKTNLALEEFSEPNALKAINELRLLLGGEALTELRSSLLKSGIIRPTSSTNAAVVNAQSIDNYTESLISRQLDEVNRITKIDEELRHLLNHVRLDSTALKSHTKTRLLNLGVEMLDDSGECPLCGHLWNARELKDKIEGNLTSARAIAPVLEEIRTKSQLIRGEIASVLLALESIESGAEKLGLSSERDVLSDWRKRLKVVEDSCVNAVENYPPGDFGSAEFRSVFESAQFFTACQAVRARALETNPCATPEDKAWDTLSTLEGIVPQYAVACKDLASATAFKIRAESLHDCFESTRNSELGALYEGIKDRFAEFYRAIHDDENSRFDATLKADGKFEVDFYGRGLHPPLALHSEGHQDSMGLCLYLALAERLTKGKCDVTVLDDVLMSVDQGHRREVCRLLKTFFPDRQFLITTHDSTWAKQLVMEGVVKSAGSFEFRSWSVDSGPSVEVDAELWADIAKDLKKNDTIAASARLRNGAERFFESVCDSILAEIQYRSACQWDLGDYMNSAIKRFRKILSLAKAAENSWGRKTTVEELNELDSVSAQVIERTKCEQWAVNASLHYNLWHNLHAKELQPIVDAFGDCFRLFKCNSCNGMLRVIESQNKATSVRCSCLKVNWNLEQKPKK